MTRETCRSSSVPGEPHGPSRLAAAPVGAVVVPDAVRRLAGDAALVAVWENEVGGLTFRVDGGRTEPGGARFVKWSPPSARAAGVDLVDEARRLRWAASWTPVPEVLDAGSDPDGEWLVTRALPGESAVSPRWLGDPRTAVRAVGAGLRALHDALPVGPGPGTDGCPFVWSVEERVERAAARGVTVDPALLADAPDVDRLVVCHGDACAPNTLLADDGTWLAHVDLGRLGLADRWADLAVATWSTVWNYGPGWEAELLDAYGIDPDPDRTRFYRALWDAT